MFLYYAQENPAWFVQLQGILGEVTRGEALLVTSTLAMAEVAFAESELASGPLDPDAFTAIDALWFDETFVRLIDPDSSLMLEARAIVRRGKAVLLTN